MDDKPVSTSPEPETTCHPLDDKHLSSLGELPARCHLIDDKLSTEKRYAWVGGSAETGCNPTHFPKAKLAPPLLSTGLPPDARNASGRAYFITNGEPILLWEWINGLLTALGEPPVTGHISLRAASALGLACELAWRALPLRDEPPMTRFIAQELATDHWFNLTAARRDLGYIPRISMALGTAELVAHLKLTPTPHT